MITRYHGIDKHKKYSTISVLNRQGEEVDFRQKCYDLKEYIENLLILYDIYLSLRSFQRLSSS